MFDTGRRRLGPWIGRKRQGILNILIGALFVAPEFFPGETFSWWRLSVGAALVFFGVYGVVTAGPSNDEPL